MSKREAIITIELAFDFLLPHATPPIPLPHVRRHWLKLASIGQILDLIEQASTQTCGSAEKWIFRELQKINPEGTNAN